MNWRGQELKTIGEITDAMKKIKTKEEAAEFKAAYRLLSRHADSNLGYLTGYFGPKEADRLRELFEVSHPVFGNKNPTPAQALEAGMIMGKNAKRQSAKSS